VRFFPKTSNVPSWKRSLLLQSARSYPSPLVILFARPLEGIRGILGDLSMRPPRLKLRTMLVLVALVALGMGGVEYARRFVRYRALAAQVAAREKASRIEAARYRAAAAAESRDYRKWIELEEGIAMMYGRRRAAYLRCAQYPWLSPPSIRPADEEFYPTRENRAKSMRSFGLR
jgi:hypothetical protein